MYYIGLMSGTSMDAIDVALVRFEDKAILEHYRQYPISTSLRQRIRHVNEKTELGVVANLDNELGHLFADSVNQLLEEIDIDHKKIIAIGSHGQTVLHRPDIKTATSIQIADPNIICAKTGITTVADFRRMDMAYGGQGAPLACAFHQYQFQKNGQAIIILNIGGMANLTLIPAKADVIGFDTGPGNALLDDWIQINLGKEYDEDSNWGLSGEINKNLLDVMLNDPYFAKIPPKSTGREYFNINWLNSLVDQTKTKIVAQDIQATLLELTLQTIIDAINRFTHKAGEVLVCGGGAANKTLMGKLQDKLDIEITTTEKYGLSPDCIEAVTFAWLAKQRIEVKPANLPSVTGAKKKAILGGIYSPY